MELRKAQRKQAKLRVGLSGPSGSGKTYSALQLASGMTSWDKIALIDTENGSGDLYAHLGAYSVLPLSAPFEPEKYMEAIKACEDAGMEVIIVDSMSHAWAGAGGALETQEKLGGRYQDWGKVKPRVRKFVESILASKCHVIATVRTKQDYTMDQVDGKTKVTKVGLKAVFEDGLDYELTLVFDLNIAHMAAASKDRTGLFMDKTESVINPATGKKLLEWAESGDVPSAVIPQAEASPEPTPDPILDAINALPPINVDEAIAELDKINDVDELKEYFTHLRTSYEYNDDLVKVREMIVSKGNVLKEKPEEKIEEKPIAKKTTKKQEEVEVAGLPF